MAFRAPFENSYYEPDKFFHLDQDPCETNNLASNPEFAAKHKEMKAKLATLLDDAPGTYPGLKGGV
ncbi:MAG: hypothetical protein ACN4GF_03610 [Lentimonas sp.]